MFNASRVSGSKLPTLLRCSLMELRSYVIPLGVITGSIITWGRGRGCWPVVCPCWLAKRCGCWLAKRCGCWLMGWAHQPSVSHLHTNLATETVRRRRWRESSPFLFEGKAQHILSLLLRRRDASRIARAPEVACLGLKVRTQCEACQRLTPLLPSNGRSMA